MKNYLLSLVAFIVILFIVTACSKMPQAEIDAAKAAVNNVQLSEAGTYAPESYLALQDSLSRALNLVETKNSKLFKNFDEPIQKLLEVEAMAEKVKAEAENNKTAMIAEIQNMLNETALLNTESNELVGKAPKGKEGRLALESIKADITAVDAQNNETRGMLNQNLIMQARTKAQLTLQKARDLNGELKTIIAKTRKA